MENSPLPLAHKEQRQADRCLKQKQFDECIECHQRAIKHLINADKSTENFRTKQSLSLQISYHEKQIEVVRMMKIQMEAHKESSENQKQKMALKKLKDLQLGTVEDDLQRKIYHTMEVHDSLLQYLGKTGGGNSDDSFSVSDTEEYTPGIERNIVGNKHPKNEGTIIEELRVLCDELRGSVVTLMVELDNKNKIIAEQNQKIAQLESQNAQRGGNSLKVTDSSGGTSPFNDLSPDLQDITPYEMHRKCITLPPLEPVPNFDFSSLSIMQSSSHNNN